MTTAMALISRALEKVGIRVENGIADMILPGVLQSEVDPSGVLSVWKLSAVLEAGRAVVIKKNFQNLAGLFISESSLFVRQVRYHISPELSTPLSSVYNSTVNITVRLLSRGTTSVTMEQILREARSEVELARLKLRFVYVDMITRRPKPLPSYFCQQIPLMSFSEDNRYVHPDPPKNTFTWTVPVENHHIDRNQHTNQSRYLQFCWDAAMAAARQGYFTGIPPDSVKFSVSDITALYDGESVEGDILTVTTWSDDSIQCIYFNIDLRNKRIFRCCWILRQL